MARHGGAIRRWQDRSAGESPRPTTELGPDTVPDGKRDDGWLLVQVQVLLALLAHVLLRQWLM